MLIQKSILFGSGEICLDTKNSFNISFINSEIKECSSWIMILEGISNMQFQNSKFDNNIIYFSKDDFIRLSGTKNIIFNNCLFFNNKNKQNNLFSLSSYEKNIKIFKFKNNKK